MDLSKFINLLGGDLYFNSIFNFEDNFEGRVPNNRDKIEDIYRKTNGKWEKIDGDNKKNLETIEFNQGKHQYILCFHCNEYESSFMWKLYAENKGIAICTTKQRLEKCFDGRKDIIIEPVKYVDYDKIPKEDDKESKEISNFALYKRKSFEAEKEVRCILTDINNSYPEKKGILVPVKLEVLIDRIYVSPYAPRYLRNDIERIVKLHGLKIDVISSKLNELS